MIGRYLALLTPEEEDRVLVQKLYPGDYTYPCLVGAVLGITPYTSFQKKQQLIRANFDREELVTRVATKGTVEERYDDLCDRFGTERINAVIRARIVRRRTGYTFDTKRAL